MNDNFCEECGEFLEGEEEFNAIADQIDALLEDASPEDEMAILTMFLGRWLSRWRPEDYEEARSDILDALDRQAKSWIIQKCDA
jgi:NDP-sugar pyrophosphorylase family protein